MSSQSVSRSVFVTDLSPEVTQIDLLNAFCGFGVIQSVRVVCDRQTKSSLGYGYVNFNDEGDARRAIDAMNFATIKGRQIRAMAVHSNPDLLKSNKANIFVKNLDKSIDNKTLYDLFLPFGPIVSCKVAQEDNGNSKGHGFVQFESEESAVAAIADINGRQCKGKTLFCSKFMNKDERQKYIPKSYANIYVKNFDHYFDEKLIQELFSKFGKVVAVKVVYNYLKQFAFIALEDSGEADEAIKVLNGKYLPNGNTLYVSRAFKKILKIQKNKQLIESRGDGRSVYVKYLDPSCDPQSLKQMFSPFGPISSVYTYPEIPLFNGFAFGFVMFTSTESAIKAVQNMNNKLMANKALYVSIPRPMDLINSCSMLTPIEPIRRLSTIR